MTVKITIIGLGKIGTSAGLALARHTDQVYRLGHDIHPEHARRAQKMAAIDKVVYNLPASVVDADIVLLTLPLDQIRETLEIISPDLKEGAVVMDTSPVKAAVSDWAATFLPPGRYYVGLTPVLNPLYLLGSEVGGEAGREDLFQNGLMGIVAPRGTSSAAIKLAADLTTLLGAQPLFMDMVEVDSLMAALHVIPQLLAAGLVSATVGQPGWLEGRKVAGAPFAQAGTPLVSSDTPEALGSAAMLSQEHVLRVLDRVVAYLQSFRAHIAAGEEEQLIEQLKTARSDREAWWEQRMQGQWEQPDMDMEKVTRAARSWFSIGRRQGD